MGILYVVATPIGNLEDMTHRAVRVLKEVALIAAEDTRKTRKLLTHFDIHTPMESYHRHSTAFKRERIVAALGTADVAVVSEAGMPGVSDPGQDLIAAAIAAGHRVVPVPGPSALLSALVVSGLPTERFLFVGFLPRVRADRRKLLASLATAPYTLVIFEAPHRLLASLADLEAELGDREAAAARELTKVHEEVVRGRLSEIRRTFEERPPRGEFTLVVAQAPAPSTREAAIGVPSVPELARQLRAEGLRAKDAVRRLVEDAGVSRNEAYQAWLESGRTARA
ncbi:MAG TPA: 16S rRNA (cytidine(1402)-2'-O)-methyltransferase [Chloroflexota bacterium]